MRKRIWLPLLVLVLASAGLLALPRARPIAFDGGYRSCRARVLAVDASAVERTGLVDYGTEKLRVELLDGPDRGRVFAAENELRAQPDIDKRFAVGDIALVACPPGELADDCILDARDHWRLGRAAALFVAFAVLLVAFSGLTGLSALFSFVFSCLAVWKLLIPLCLDGWNPLWTTFLTVSLLTAVIMYLVAGATRKGLAAFLGAMLGVIGANQFTVIFDVVPSQYRAGSIGFLNVIAGLVGSTAPIALGALSEARGVGGFEVGFASMAAVQLVAVAGLVSAMLFTFRKDRI